MGTSNSGVYIARKYTVSESLSSPASELTGYPPPYHSVFVETGTRIMKKARADVAQFVVEQLTSDTWLRRTPVILW
jgi:hypothetical protein